MRGAGLDVSDRKPARFQAARLGKTYRRGRIAGRNILADPTPVKRGITQLRN